MLSVTAPASNTYYSTSNTASTYSTLMNNINTYLAQGNRDAALREAAQYADYLTDKEWEQLREVLNV